MLHMRRMHYMIKTKKDLKEYMEADRKQLGVNRKYPRPFTDEIWRYEIYLRPAMKSQP